MKQNLYAIKKIQKAMCANAKITVLISVVRSPCPVCVIDVVYMSFLSYHFNLHTYMGLDTANQNCPKSITKEMRFDYGHSQCSNNVRESMH